MHKLMRVFVVVCFAAVAFAQVPTGENAYYGYNGVWQGARFDKSAEQPRQGFFTEIWATPSTGKLITVAAGSDAVAAMNSANCGDSIQLEAGAAFTIAPVNLLRKNCDSKHWISMTSSYVSGHWKLPYHHRRINPSYAGVTSLPGRPAFSGGSGNSMAKLIVTGNAGFTPGDHWRITGIEITRPSDGKPHSALVYINAPYNIFDRNWIHGDPVAETTHGIIVGAGADHAAMLGNYMDDFHCTAITGTCTDAQAISDSEGGSTIKIVDNFLEGAGENIEFGGGAATSIPSDIEVRLNHFFKPLTWDPSSPTFAGMLPIVKNHFELKAAQRVLFEGNYLENVWGGFTQKGGSILITPKNQSGANGSNICPICIVTDVTVRYNYDRHGSQVLQIANVMSDNKGWALGGYRYSIHDLIAEDFQYSKCNQCGMTTVEISTGYSSTNPPPSAMNLVNIDHVTAITANPPTLAFLNMDGPPAGNATSTLQMSGINLTNSIFETGGSGVYPTGGGADNCAVAPKTVADKILACWIGPSSFTGNLIVTKALKTPTTWPAGNQLVADWSAIAFANFAAGDYHLTTLFKGTGTDGKDPGADVSAVMAMIPFAQ